MDKQDNLIELLDHYNNFIFDLDGTLVDLGVDWIGLKQDLSKIAYEEIEKKIEFTPLDQKVNEIKLVSKKAFNKLLEKIAEYELREENYKPNWNLISYLNSSRKRFAIYSMNTQKCVDRVIKMYLTRKPSIVISKDNCLESKPTACDLQKILSVWEIKNKEVVFIGNSFGDQESGKMAKVKTILI